jgi:hypothetical protein
MRDRAWYGEIKDLDAAEDKQNQDHPDPQEYHTDQSQDANLFGLGAIESWQPNKQQQSTNDKDNVRRDRFRATEAIWTRNKKDEQKRKDRANCTDQQELALKTYGHMRSTSFRIDEQDVSRAGAERHAAKESIEMLFLSAICFLIEV